MQVGPIMPQIIFSDKYNQSAFSLDRLSPFLICTSRTTKLDWLIFTDCILFSILFCNLWLVQQILISLYLYHAYSIIVNPPPPYHHHSHHHHQPVDLKKQPECASWADISPDAEAADIYQLKKFTFTNMALQAATDIYKFAKALNLIKFGWPSKS